MATEQGGGDGFDARDIPGAVWDFIKSNPEVVLGAVQAYTSARRATQGDKITEQALADLQEDRGLRLQQRERLLGGNLTEHNVPRPDLTSVFADPGNPFATPIDRPAIAGVGGGASRFQGVGGGDRSRDERRRLAEGALGGQGGGMFSGLIGEIPPESEFRQRLKRQFEEAEARKAANIQGVR